MNLATFFAEVRPLFGGHLNQGQVDGMNVILEAFGRHGDGNQRHLAYLLATAKHETAHTMQPIHERGQRSYFDKYEPGTSIGKALGNTVKGDGYLYRGRGYVQLTGRDNYRRAGGKLNADLLGSPDMALQPHIAAAILIKGCIEGWFTGKKLGDYTTFRDMRRVVNGTDRADAIALIADGFLRALNAAAQVIAPTISPQPEAEPEDAIAPPPEKRPAAASEIGIAAAIILIILAAASGAALYFWG